MWLTEVTGTVNSRMDTSRLVLVPMFQHCWKLAH